MSSTGIWPWGALTEGLSSEIRPAEIGEFHSQKERSAETETADAITFCPSASRWFEGAVTSRSRERAGRGLCSLVPGNRSGRLTMERPNSSVHRCAVYTRKSSEEGLEQDFNSLHAQREACESFIKSRAGEGWRLVKTAYDNGGG